MKLIDGLHMPPFARLQWVSKAAEDTYAPRLQRAIRAYGQLELLSVEHNLRRVCTMHFRPEQLAEGTLRLARKGLTYLPIRQVGVYSGFAHHHPPVISGQPWTYYGVVARDPQDAALFRDSSEERSKVDHETIGMLLGYPQCCRRFFTEVWQEKGFVDPIYQAAENAVKTGNAVYGSQPNTIWVTDYNPMVLSVLRYVGVRVSPHIPCSPACEHSFVFAAALLDLAEKCGVPGLNDLMFFLRLPLEWDCLKGVAYIRSPLFKIETNSMACTEKHVVRFVGAEMPEHAAHGLDFPFNNKKTRQGVRKALSRFEEAVRGQERR